MGVLGLGAGVLAVACAAPPTPTPVPPPKPAPAAPTPAPKAAAPTAAPAAKPPAAKEPVKARMWVQGDPKDPGPVAQLRNVTFVNEFQQKFPNIKFELEGVSERIDLKLFVTAKAGDVPDITMYSGQMQQNHAFAGTLTALDDYTKAEPKQFIEDLFWIETETTKSTLDGKKYGFLYSVHARGMWRRKDLIPDAPKSWDDIIKHGKANANGTDKWGFVFFGQKPWSIEVEYGPFVWSQDGKLSDGKEGRAVWANDEVYNAVKLHRDFVHEHKISPISTITAGFGDAWKLFLTGQVAMCVQGTYGLNQAKNTDGKALWDAGKLEFDLIPTKDGNPEKSSRNFGNGWAWGIPKGAKYADAGWEWIKFFSTRETQVRWSLLEGGLPIRPSAWDDKAFELPIYKKFRQAVEKGARPMDLWRTYIEAIETVGAAVEEATLKPDTDIKKILKDSQDAFNGKYFK
ncbi:MAG: extracellular solute-binding protein [Chloroflexi bacterium]|nr:extracellular solute-binding protein [Chloroflexota bacterium]